jgi:hypothetical protein
VTIARRRAAILDTIAASMPAIVEPRPKVGPASLPIGLHDIPAPESMAPVGRLRRCTFRRIDRLEALPGRLGLPVYEIMCLYRGQQSLMALGDIDSARPVCEACTATGIFRPDEA